MLDVIWPSCGHWVRGGDLVCYSCFFGSPMGLKWVPGISQDFGVGDWATAPCVGTGKWGLSKAGVGPGRLECAETGTGCFFKSWK